MAKKDETVVSIKTIRVKLQTSINGPSGTWSDGDVVEIEAGWAERLIAKGRAVRVEE